MKKLYINYIFNTCTEVFPTAEAAVQNALKNETNGEYIYLNHYTDSDSGIDAWEAYIADDGDMDGTRYIEKDNWNGLGDWEDEWNTEKEITIVEEEETA